MEMNELLIFAVCLAVMALSLLIRVGKGPSVVDRVVAADSIDILMKDGSIADITQASELLASPSSLSVGKVRRYYLCYSR